MKTLTTEEQAIAVRSYLQDKIAMHTTRLRTDLQGAVGSDQINPGAVSDFVRESIKREVNAITRLFDMEDLIK